MSVKNSKYSKRPGPKHIGPPALHTDPNLGNRSFGKAKLSCRWLQTKSHWGTFEKKPAGVLRLKIIFHEEADYRLEKANIHLSFLPETTAPKESRSQETASLTTHDQEFASDEDGPVVEVTDHIYPGFIYGPEIAQQVNRGRTGAPEITVMGSGGKIGDWRGSEDWKRTYRWRLKGDPDAGEDNADYYTRVLWAWEANRLDTMNVIKQSLDFAVLIRHAKARFIAELSINGSLFGFGKKFRFGDMWPWGQREYTPKTTPMDPLRSQRAYPTAKLDTLVKGLEENMKHINLGTAEPAEELGEEAAAGAAAGAPQEGVQEDSTSISTEIVQSATEVITTAIESFAS